MIALKPTTRTTVLLLLGGAVISANGRSQTGTPASPPIQSTPSPTNNKPIPDIVALMHDVEANERKAEAIEKDYLYHSVVTEQKVDSHGQVKQTEVTEYDHFWVNGVPVARMVKKDGRALSADQVAKENERIDKESAKARDRRDKADAQGKETNPRGDEEITVSRLLELGAFTNPRRVQLNGRDTIAVDFTGDPKARTRNRAEEVIRDMAGTAWIDEQDHVLARVDGRFVNPFKVGGGLVVNIQKNTRFTFEQTKVNNEVWLPAHIDGQGAARVLLFFNFNGSLRAVESDYRKFRTSSTILPGVTQVIPPPQQPDSPAGGSNPH